ncbi:DUF2933 domain-containing protein [Candidatus Saccharibacteria bacterium]|jgi:archaellum biogenesis protein FlaJ (TadC family)|nr:DUF2933 domain-containing protein [Candidatus Saccharibacteria bacterium]HPR09668.1 hypothetical protein [Candidatus Saccharibacteria bacterium]
MKTHNTISIVLVVLAVALVVFAPTLNVSRGFGLLLLICPLMMLGMMAMMDHNKDNHK